MLVDSSSLLLEYDSTAEDKGRYWLAKCPSCGQKTLYSYKDSFTATCNRLNNCGFKSKLRGLPGVSKPFRHDPRQYTLQLKIDQIKRRKARRPKQEIIPVHKEISNCLGKIEAQAVAYLEYRLPNINVKEKIFQRKIAGVTRRMEDIHDNNPRWLDKKGYKLLVPLYNIKSGQIVSAQTRFCLFTEDPSLSANGKFIKTRSLKCCPYGEGGATFGSLEKAIEKSHEIAAIAGQIPTLIIAEGDIDYLTLRACGYDNVVGVPGAAQAKNVIRHLQDIEWSGVVIMSLDGDNAGNKSLKEVKKIIEGKKILICNARTDDTDINDIYKQWGQVEAVRRVIYYAQPTRNRSRSANTEENKNFRKLIRHGLWATPDAMPKFAKDRYRVLIKHDSKCIKKSIGRAVNCQEVKEVEIFYKDGTMPIKAGIRTRVAETPTCNHCAAVQWNLVIGNYLLDNWPPRLHYARFPFPPGDLDEATRIKSEIHDITRLSKRQVTRDRSGGKSLFTIIDFTSSNVIAICGSSNRNDIVMTTLRAAERVESGSKEQVLREIVLPAYLSYSQYISEMAQDFGHVLITDPILITKFKRYGYRKELSWPKMEDVKKEVRQIRALQAEALKDEVGLGEGYSVFVTFRERLGIFKKLIGLSWKSLSFDNITASDIYGLPMKFDPGDPQAGNFLDSPRLAPKPIDEIINDFFWVHYGHPAFIGKGHEIPPAYVTPTQKAKILAKAKKGLPQSKEDYRNMLIQWGEAGYDPNKHNFLPGSVPLSRLKETPPL